MSAAAEVIDRLNTLPRDVVRLARVSSIAARLEPALLRSLRLKFLPGSDAGLEADLRFSPLTRSHNASSIVLRTEVVELLRKQLAEPRNRSLLDRAWQIVKTGHQSAPSVIQLEEKVTWLALRGDIAASELETELKRAVHAMTQEDRPGMAQWVARALPRLPARARQTEAAWLLAVGAATRLGGMEILGESPPVNVSPELVRAVLPPETSTTQIGVRLLEDGIEFGDVGLPGAKLLRVPKASPVTLDLKWLLEGSAADEASSEPREAGRLQSAILRSDPVLVEVASGRRVITLGSRQQPGIGTVQDALNQLKERDASLLVTLGPSSRNRGFFDPRTQEAVRNFQRLHRLTVDGLIGKDTIIALDRALQNTRVIFSLGSRNKFQPPGDAATRGIAEIQITTALGEQHYLRRTEKVTCFVVMGFGKKTDFETGRVLDLDQSYLNLIKPAVEASGLKCVRADEIVHSGLIDVPMYEMLLKADVVVADLSTSNRNAIYQLGVRHVLRPYTTVVIAEEQMMKSPFFDLNHLVIRQYRHLGEDIAVSEIKRFTGELTETLTKILATEPELRTDSPVYKFIDGLTPPSIAAEVTSSPGE